MYAYIFETTQRIMMRFLIDRLIQEEDLYVYNIYNIEKKTLELALRPCETGAYKSIKNTRYSSSPSSRLVLACHSTTN
jgi:hypothetical protein